MSEKQRLSATVDAELLVTAQQAVADGRAATLSAWVNDALRLKADHDARLAALDRFLAAFESEHGPISDADIEDAERRARGRAVVVRGARAAERTKPRGRAPATRKQRSA